MKEKKEKPWFKTRGYIHFTKKINSKGEARITKYVQNKTKVALHAFYPLLHKKISQRRYKSYKDKNGVCKKGHKKINNGKIESSKKIRPIFYATHIDAQIYAYYSKEILQKKYKNYLDNHPELSACITAYRRIPINPNDEFPKHKSSIHFAKEVFEHIKERGECIAMAYDIKSFFTNLDHKILKKAWANLLGTKVLPQDHYNIFKSVTNFSYINLKDFRKGAGFDESELSRNRKEGIEAFFESSKEFRKQINQGEIRIYKNQYHNEKKVIKNILEGFLKVCQLAQC